MEVMMVGEGCNGRISDVQKSGGVCNSDAIDQGGGTMIGKWGKYRDVIRGDTDMTSTFRGGGC